MGAVVSGDMMWGECGHQRGEGVCGGLWERVWSLLGTRGRSGFGRMGSRVLASGEEGAEGADWREEVGRRVIDCWEREGGGRGCRDKSRMECGEK